MRCLPAVTHAPTLLPPPRPLLHVLPLQPKFFKDCQDDHFKGHAFKDGKVWGAAPSLLGRLGLARLCFPHDRLLPLLTRRARQLKIPVGGLETAHHKIVMKVHLKDDTAEFSDDSEATVEVRRPRRLLRR